MKNVVTALLLMLFSSVAVAHEGHKAGSGNPYKDFEIPIDFDDARKFAKDVIDKLVDKHKITASWHDAVFLDAQQKVFKKDLEWIVSYKNEQIGEESKQVLYVFFSLYGEFLGINYTGH